MPWPTSYRATYKPAGRLFRPWVKSIDDFAAHDGLQIRNNRTTCIQEQAALTRSASG